MSIIVKNLSKTFHFKGKSREVLADVNLEVDSGRIFALMGPNGSGKTTFLKILSTLILPANGEASVSGYNVVDAPDKVREKIGLVWDSDRSFYQVLNVEENLKFFGRLLNIPEKSLAERIDSLLGQFNLLDWKSAKISHCSSGIKQKVAMVRAVLHDPEVILIDEPTRSLDDKSRKEINSYIRSFINSDKKTCLMVTHDLDEAKNLADGYGYLREGKIEVQKK
ncbi:MAG: ABC transporter ATP-binding protein [Endomicrobiales bacterium]|nr:ABC transporter ATP-binding protein [Endomicrobiales bacterium]